MEEEMEVGKRKYWMRKEAGNKRWMRKRKRGWL